MEELLGTQPVKILKDVIAFVDVRSGHDNRSQSVSRQLEMLGATVSKSLNRRVTHVIFKDGSISSYKRAKRMKVHLLSVLWVESCKENKSHVSEKLFPALIENCYNSPITNLKRVKSFQPVSWEVDMKRSAALLKRKRRRQELDGVKSKLLSPAVTEATFAKTINVDTNGERDFLLENVANLDDYDTSKSSNCIFDEDESSEMAVPSLASRLINLFPESPLLLQSLSRQQAAVKPKTHKTFNDSVEVFNEIEIDSVNASCLKDDNSQSDVFPKTAVDEMQYLNLSSGTELEKRYIDVGKRLICEVLPKSNPSRCVDKENYTNRMVMECEHSHSHPEYLSRSKLQDNETNASFQLELKAVTTNECRVENEMTLMCDKVKLMSFDRQIKDREGYVDHSQTPSGYLVTSRRSVDDFKNVPSKDYVGSPSISSIIKRQKPHHKSTRDYRTVKHIVLTSLQACEKEAIVPIIKTLGKCRLATSVNGRTTHLICGEMRRTFSMLMAIANGCWIVCCEWVYRSLEAGRWVSEEPYEFCHVLPAAKISRMEKEIFGRTYRCELFKDLPPMSITGVTKLPEDYLKHLVIASGGKVVPFTKSTRISIGQHVEDSVIVCITDLWVLDSVTQFKVLPFTKYLISKVN